MKNFQQITYSMLSKSWHHRPVIECVEYAAVSGEFTVLCGENGSGKTTLLKIMAGLVRPDHCQVDLQGRQATWKQARRDLIKHTLYLHQTPYMFSGSVYRNMLLSINQDSRPAEHKKRIEEILKSAQLEQHKHAAANTLSGGQQQRVALARASLNGSAFLFLDEPTANMDAHSIERTLRFLQEFKQSGTAIMVSTHNPKTFEGLSDRVLVLENKVIRQQ